MRRIVSDAGYTAASHITVALAQVALQIYVARHTTLATFGTYATALAIATAVEAIFLARSGELALQFIGRHWIRGEAALAYWSGRRIRALDWRINWALWGAIAAGVTIYPGGMTTLRWYVVLLALAIPAQIGFGVSKSIFIAMSKLKAQAVFEMIYSIAGLVLGVIGFMLGSIVGLLVSLVLVAMLKTLTAQAITGRWWPPAALEPTVAASSRAAVEGHAWTAFGIHSLIRNAFLNGANQIDVLLLAAVRGSEAVALYKVAKTIAGLPARAAGPIWAAIRPRLMRAWHTADRRTTLALIGWPSLIALLGLILAIIPADYLADDLLRLLFGPRYVSGSPILVILLVGTWLFGAATGWFNFWVIVGQERRAGTIIYGFLFVSILLGAAAAGVQSPLTMAITVSISMTLTSVACWSLLFTRLRNLSPEGAQR